jgi:NAD+ kinase
MATIGLIVHQGRDSASEQAGDLATWLVDSGHQVRVPESQTEGLPDAVTEVDESVFADGLDLVATLGGDGSMLRAVELVGASETPILGVDHGQLGYLTEVEPGHAREAVARFLANDYAIDRRNLLEVTVDPKNGEPSWSGLALNEAVVERTADANTIRLRIEIDGEFFTTYAADGMIVATATGSTAYAFSARGPIIDPRHRCLLLSPVSPHMLFDRSMVLDPETSVVLTVDGHRPASVSLDGRRVAVVSDNASIRCSLSDYSARLVTFGTRRFHHVLKTKFGLNDR